MLRRWKYRDVPLEQCNTTLDTTGSKWDATIPVASIWYCGIRQPHTGQVLRWCLDTLVKSFAGVGHTGHVLYLTRPSGLCVYMYLTLQDTPGTLWWDKTGSHCGTKWEKTVLLDYIWETCFLPEKKTGNERYAHRSCPFGPGGHNPIAHNVLINGCRRSTLPQDCQLDTSISNSEQ